ncbi:hypothetical protein H0H93_004873 [Arthromyces matolae]|nr:hypothetical protein H0H93_004873 [Arthromyces matolae]
MANLYYLCVDCGGTKTSAVITDSNGSIVARAIGGPSNFAYLSTLAFLAAVSSTIQDALSSCSSTFTLPLTTHNTPFISASFGVSGVDSPSAIATLTPAISALIGLPEGPNLHISNDTHLLAAPLLTHPDISTAVAVIAGTGSIAVSFRLNPQTRAIEELGRIGGWGWILGDEGGGFSVGREAVRQMLLDFDKASVLGRPSTNSPLIRRVLDKFQVAEVPDMLPLVHLRDPLPDSSSHPSHVNQAREKRLSSLAPLVFEAAFEENDPFAQNILKICASYLAEEIAILLGDDIPSDQLKSSKAVSAKESVVSFGGSLVRVVRYREMILDELKRKGHTFKYVEFVEDAAAVGAKALAMSANVKAEACLLPGSIVCMGRKALNESVDERNHTSTRPRSAGLGRLACTPMPDRAKPWLFLSTSIITSKALYEFSIPSDIGDHGQMILIYSPFSAKKRGLLGPSVKPRNMVANSRSGTTSIGGLNPQSTFLSFVLTMFALSRLATVAAAALLILPSSIIAAPAALSGRSQSSSSVVQNLLPGLLGIAIGALNIPVGLDCDPVGVLVGITGVDCSAQTVCCEDNTFNGVIAIGCVPINLNI